MNIRPIKTEHDYTNSLNQIESLMDANPNTPQMDELEVLTTLVEAYEEQHYKIESPDPIEAIKFRMEQDGLKQKDLITIVGSKSRVSEILNKKALSLSFTLPKIFTFFFKFNLSINLLIFFISGPSPAIR